MKTTTKKPAVASKILHIASKKTKSPILKSAAARSGQWVNYPLTWSGLGFTAYNTAIRYDSNIGLMVITLNFERNAAITANTNILQLPANVLIMGYSISSTGHLFYAAGDWIRCTSNINANTRIYATTLVVPF